MKAASLLAACVFSLPSLTTTYSSATMGSKLARLRGFSADHRGLPVQAANGARDMRETDALASAGIPSSARPRFVEAVYDPSMGDQVYDLDGNNNDKDTLTLTGVNVSDVVLSTDASNSLFITSRPEVSPPFRVSVTSQFKSDLAYPSGNGYGFDHLIFKATTLDRDAIRGKASLWSNNDESVVHAGSDLDETFIIGSGNAEISGGGGTDTYVVRRGSGDVQISDGPEDNRLVFEDISSNEAQFQRDGLSLKITLTDPLTDQEDSYQETVIANQFYQNIFSAPRFGVETITFSDVTLERDDINRLVGRAPQPVTPAPASAPADYPTRQPSVGGPLPTSAPSLKPRDSRYVQEGTDGNDRLFGVSVSVGDLGTDQYANTFIGKKGDDLLNGSNAPDVYVFAKGDGRDTIYESVSGNELSLSDYVREELDFRRDGSDLIVKPKNESSLDEIKVTDHFAAKNSDGGPALGAVSVRFSNGEVFTAEDILDAVGHAVPTSSPTSRPTEPFLGTALTNAPTVQPTASSGASGSVSGIVATSVVLSLLAALATVR